MALHWSEIPPASLQQLRRGSVIPAHPLALTADRKLDPRRQRALTRYYLDAGSGGLAVGVHTTQFAIRDVGLYEPVLRLAAEAAADVDVQAAVPHRRPGGPDAAGRRRGAGRARSRLPCRPAEPRRAEGRAARTS